MLLGFLNPQIRDSLGLLLTLPSLLTLFLSASGAGTLLGERFVFAMLGWNFEVTLKANLAVSAEKRWCLLKGPSQKNNVLASLRIKHSQVVNSRSPEVNS